MNFFQFLKPAACSLSLLFFTSIARATVYSIANSEAAFSALTLHDGDTVNIAAGTATWSSQHSIGVGVTIAGAGAPTPITGSKPTTIISRNPSLVGAPLFYVTADAAASFRCTGIAFQANDSTQDDNGLSNFFQIAGGYGNKLWRIDHCDFYSNPSATGGPAILIAIIVYNATYPGLIDQNTFEFGANSEIIHNMGGSNPDTAPTGSAPAFADWGNANSQAVSLFVENNVFTNNLYLVSGNVSYFLGNSSIQNYYGARFTFRYNTLTMSQVDAHGGNFGQVGPIDANGLPGTRWYEIYNNTWIVPTPTSGMQYCQSQLMDIRGGSGVIFNNTLNCPAGNDGVPNIQLIQDYNNAAYSPTTYDTYPQLWQVGQGLESGSAVAPAQSRDPLYIWNNGAGSTAIVTTVEGNSTTYIQQNRDFYCTSDSSGAKPGYAAYTYPYPVGSGGSSSPSISSSLSASATLGAGFSYQITALSVPTSFGASPLPAGLSVNTATGAISGTPTSAGVTKVTLTASNSSGTASAVLVLTVVEAPPVITSVLSTLGTVASVFTYDIAAKNGATTYSASNLPAGLSINSSTGVITGTPSVSGTFQVTISATNSSGTTSQTLSITIGAVVSGTVYNIPNSESAFAALTLHDGDTVNIAAGTATWSNQHTISKGVTIAGAGTPAPTAGQKPTTIIARSGGLVGHPLFLVTTDSANSFRVTGIGFQANNSVQDGNGFSNFFQIQGGAGKKVWRLDHCDFYSNPSATGGPAILIGILVFDGSYPGLIDQNTFEFGANAEMIHNQGASTAATSPTGSAPSLADWGNAINQGVMLFVERNVFTNNRYYTVGGVDYFIGNSAIDNYDGARVTFRYNTLNMTQFDADGGNYGSTGPVDANDDPGTRWMEVYNNYWFVPAPSNGVVYGQSQMVDIGAGSGVIFNNYLNCPGGNDGTPNIQLHQDYNSMAVSPTTYDTYPQLWQVGRGAESGSATSPTLSSSPLYIWNNNTGPTPVNLAVDSHSSIYIQVNRDYFFSTTSGGAKPGYVPFTYPYPY